jgi:hypothetical protein
MAVTGKLYGKAILNAFGGETAGESIAIDYLSDTIKVALTTSSYSVDQDTHEFFSDITNEITGTGYTAGGATLANKTLGYTAGTNVIKFDADDTSWAASTLTARYAIVYKDTGTGSTSPLLGYVDFGADVSTTSGTFQITWNASGIFTITPA